MIVVAFLNINTYKIGFVPLRVPKGSRNGQKLLIEISKRKTSDLTDFELIAESHNPEKKYG